MMQHINSEVFICDHLLNKFSTKFKELPKKLKAYFKTLCLTSVHEQLLL